MNKVFLTGRPTRDPEVRYSADNKAVARLTLAVDRKVARNSDGNHQTADFISCVAFGKTAEFIEKYCTQGKKFAVEGRIQTGSYTNRDGNKVYTTDVVIESMEFCESKRGGEDGSRAAADTAGGTEGFMNIPDGVEDEGLPFC